MTWNGVILPPSRGALADKGASTNPVLQTAWLEMMLRMQQGYRIFDRIFADTGVNMIEFQILACLMEEGQATLSHVSELVACPKTTVHYSLQKLERNQWVKRENSGGDRADQPAFAVTDLGWSQWSAMARRIEQTLIGPATKTLPDETVAAVGALRLAAKAYFGDREQLAQCSTILAQTISKWMLKASQECASARKESKLNITHAETQDLSQVLSLRRQAFMVKAPDYYDSIQVQTLLDDCDQQEVLQMIVDQCLFVCKENGQILGTAGWKGENIRHVYVRPDQMGQGIGSSLLAYAEADYRRRTQNRYILGGVILYARGFYEKSGYRVLSREKDWDGSEYYLMRKDFLSSGG